MCGQLKACWYVLYKCVSVIVSLYGSWAYTWGRTKTNTPWYTRHPTSYTSPLLQPYEHKHHTWIVDASSPSLVYIILSCLGSKPLHNFTLMTAHVETTCVWFIVSANKYIFRNFYRLPGASVEIFNANVDKVSRDILILIGETDFDLLKTRRTRQFF